MLIGAVIVTYNSSQSIASAVHSLRHNGVNEVVVVDNASSDGTMATISSLPVKVIQNYGNLGFGLGCNIGVRHLNTTYVFFLNPDAKLHPHTLESAIQYLNEHPLYAAVGLGLCEPSGEEELGSFGGPVSLLTLFTRRFQKKRIGWVSGGAMLVRRAAFAEIGGFDPQFFMYWEDIDLCTRFRQRGLKVGRLPHAKVTHLRGASCSNAALKTKLYDVSADKYFRKHYAAPIWLLHRLLRRLYRLYSPLAH